MEEVSVLREEVKKIIDTADIWVLKMIYAMLEADRETDLWDELPDAVKVDVEEAFQQSERGEGRPHEEVIKKYKEWLTK